jgi:hypothetical protein
MTLALLVNKATPVYKKEFDLKVNTLLFNHCEREGHKGEKEKQGRKRAREIEGCRRIDEKYNTVNNFTSLLLVFTCVMRV